MLQSIIIQGDMIMTDEELKSCITSENNIDKMLQKQANSHKYDYQSPESFDIIPRFLLLDLLSGKGSARDKLIAYLCKYRDSNNKLDRTQQQISMEAEISLRTVKKELNCLAESQFLKKKYGVIMVNPLFIVRGSLRKRKYLEKIYDAFRTN